MTGFAQQLICVFLLSAFLLQHGYGRQIVNIEGQILLAFRNALTGDPFGALSSWNASDPTPCNWQGIFCNDQSQVERIVIPGVGLRGPISPILGKLEFLRTLSLPRNNLNGIIPAELGNLNTLWKLNLSSNAFSGNIPKSLGNLSRLRMLDLSGNALTNHIPAELFHNCPRLRILSLSSNILFGTIPVTLANCSRLEGINLGSNVLRGSIPLELGESLSNLKYLSLRNNFLSGVIPPELGNCRDLVSLDLGSNMLSGSPPVELGGLFNLTLLAMDDNILNATIPSDVLYLPSLQSLNLSFNLLSDTLPNRLSSAGCAQLRVLDLSSNKLSGQIPPSLVHCFNLRWINMSRNFISGSLPHTIGLLGLLHTLDISSNRLNGSIPLEIGGLHQLTFLNLGKNLISGPIPATIGDLELLQTLRLRRMKLQGIIPPELTRCRFLLELDLSGNILNGSIPRGMDNITFLRSLDLHNNSLNGSMPVELGELQHLQLLDLSNNSLSGRIPASLGNLTSLQVFNVSYNKLVGMIPRNRKLADFNITSFLGNPGLCGFPLPLHCENPNPGPAIVPAPAFAPSWPSSRSTSSSGDIRTRVFSVSAIIAIVAAALIAIGVIVVTLINMKVQRRKKTELFVYESIPPSPDASGLIVGKLVLFSKSLPSKYEDWETGTKALLDKECVIGTGPLGTVYKATFDGGFCIAVKKLSSIGRIKNQEEFEHEMGILGSLRHRNLVTLQGYYWSSTMQLLLSDYVPNGSLHRHLHERARGERPLNWAQRFRIALGTARALSYLHHDCKPRVLHFNLKSSNIILEMDGEPRVSDYGLGKLLPLLDTYMSDRKFHNVLGYVAPEITVQSLRLTEKCDVYSFGVVMLEIVTGRSPVENFDTDVRVLCEFVRSAFEQGRGLSCIDPVLRSCPETEVMQVIRLGLICTSQVPSKRPTMAEVVQFLELLKPTNTD